MEVIGHPKQDYTAADDTNINGTTNLEPVIDKIYVPFFPCTKPASLTYSVNQSPLWESGGCLASQEISFLVWNPSLLNINCLPQEPADVHLAECPE
jgi:hypothetical protein